MTRFTGRCSVILALAICCGPGGERACRADVPGRIGYQGKLTDDSGRLVADGSYTMTFRLFDALTGGAEKWSEAQAGVPVTNGLFHSLLGSTNDMTAVFQQNDALWLEITVAGETLSPRQEMAGVGYAMRTAGIGVQGGNVTIGGTLNVDTVGEKTAGAGLTIDGLNIKDGKLNTSNAVGSSPISDKAVTSAKLSLSQGEDYFGANVAIPATAAPGTTCLTLQNLPAGKYLLYGLCSCYVDNCEDVTGAIKWVINDGSTVLREGPSFVFTQAGWWVTPQTAGFTFVYTLSSTTTLNLAAFKVEGITCAVAASATRFGYIRIE